MVVEVILFHVLYTGYKYQRRVKMKKIITIFLAMLLVSVAFSQQMPEKRIENSIIVDSLVTGNGERAEDNFKITNNSNVDEIYLTIYAWNHKKSIWELACECSLTEKGKTYKKHSKTKKDLDHYRWLSLEADNIDSVKYKLSVKHEDLFIDFFDKDGPENTKNNKSRDSDLSKYQKVVQFDGFSKEQIYEGILQGCVKVFNKSSYVIEYKDKDTGVIKGKAIYQPSWTFSPTTYHYVFTMQVREGRYRITFDELTYDVGTEHVNYGPYKEKQYELMIPVFENMISTINDSINQNNSEEEDW